eukprot:COSAG01_NODE_871_length_13024_cov_115.041925_12_plen_166_part_00
MQERINRGEISLLDDIDCLAEETPVTFDEMPDQAAGGEQRGLGPRLSTTFCASLGDSAPTTEHHHLGLGSADALGAMASMLRCGLPEGGRGLMRTVSAKVTSCTLCTAPRLSLSPQTDRSIDSATASAAAAVGQCAVVAMLPHTVCCRARLPAHRSAVQHGAGAT